MKQEIFYLEGVDTLEQKIIRELLVKNKKICVLQSISSYNSAGWNLLQKSLSLSSQTATPVLVGWDSFSSSEVRNRTWDDFVQDIGNSVEPIVKLDNSVHADDVDEPLLVQLARYLGVELSKKQFFVAYYEMKDVDFFMENGFSLKDIGDNLNIVLNVLDTDFAKTFMREIGTLSAIEMVYYATVKKEFLWAAIMFFDVRCKTNINFKYMLKIGEEGSSYMYKGISAHSTMLLNRCGGWYLPNDKSGWSCPLTTKNPFEILQMHVSEEK